MRELTAENTVLISGGALKKIPGMCTSKPRIGFYWVGVGYALIGIWECVTGKEFII